MTNSSKGKRTPYRMLLLLLGILLLAGLVVLIAGLMAPTAPGHSFTFPLDGGTLL